MKAEPHFRIIEKQAFIAAVPMYIKNADGTQTPVSVQTLTDMKATVRIKNGAEVHSYTVSRDTNNNVLLDFAQGVGCYVYSVLVTAKIGGREIRTYYQEAFEGVKYNRDTTYENFITGDTVTLPDSVFVLSADTAAVASLSEQLQVAIEQAEAAKAEWQRKAEELDGVAQQATLTQGVQDIRNDISHIEIDTTTLAKETQVKDGNDTAISVGKEVRSELGTGSDTAAETGTLFAVVKWIKNKVNAITGYALQGSDNTATNTAIKQAILDNAGVPTLTIPDSTASQELAPNTLYIFAERSSTMTLTLGTPIVGIANEYHFFIVTSTTAPTINFPSGITWNGGSAPTIAADKTYEVSILNNVAAFIEIDNPEEESES